MSEAIAFSLDDPLLSQPSGPSESEIQNVLPDDVLNEAPEEPMRLRVPRSLVWAVIAVFCVAILSMAVWGLTHSTLTYGLVTIDPNMRAEISHLRGELALAGAPQRTLRLLDSATRPETNVGDALEALVNAQQSLDEIAPNPALDAPRAELRSIIGNLRSVQYGGPYSRTPDKLAITPMPTLQLSP